MNPSSTDELVAEIFKEEAGGVLSVLISQLNDFDLAEDALQDAITAALVSWRRDGIPQNGGGWLLTVARRRAIDRIRRSATARDEKAQRILLSQLEDATASEGDADQPIADERLRLIFTCCHPALAQEAQVALTLRTLCGLTTPQIARAYLVSEAAMAQRIVRAKRKIRSAGIPYEVPPVEQLDERLASVLDVVYLIFNEGFAASEGASSTRADLCLESIRLCRMLYQLMPHPEAGGLLALLLLHDARRDARTDETGAYVPIADQDRRRWDRELIAQGAQLLNDCLAQQRPGPMQIQAAISAVHAQAASAGATDWEDIAGLYTALYEMTPTAVVMLNRAVAVAQVTGPDAGLELLESVAADLEDYQPLYAARADLMRRTGRMAEAAEAYQKAIELSGNDAERNYLAMRLAQITPCH